MGEVDQYLRGYRVGHVIGRGARSAIYEVWRKGDGLRFAAKFVAIREQADRHVAQHLENEYRVLRAVHASANGKPFKGIVQPIELLKFRKLFRLCAACLVLERVQGKSLADVRDYDMPHLLRIFELTCEALEHVHKMDFVHADLKPDNIVIGPNLGVKLLDFGFAAPVGSKVRGLKGTRGFLAPEQAGGALGPYTDVFNLGAAMYWVFTNEKLPEIFPNGGAHEALIPSAMVPPKPPRQLNPELPEDLSDLILRCCEAEPSKRPSMEAVRSTLRNVRLQYELAV